MTGPMPPKTAVVQSPPLSVSVHHRFGAFDLQVEFESSHGVTALLGPSGAGKTLTLRSIAGLVRVSHGRVMAQGRVLFDSASGVDLPARDRRVGYVFQQYALLPHLTVGENVAYGLKGWPRDERNARVLEMLALVGMRDFLARSPRAISGGQQQRIALARALAPQPTVLLLDEPLAALDLPLRRRLGAELRALHEKSGVPMVLVTHDPEEAAQLADVVVRLEHGRVVVLGD